MQKENKMGVMPIKRLILSMAMPMMISMLVQALYNIVDSVYVSRISEDALTAVTLAFPLQNMMIAVSSGTGVGVNALLSRFLGQKEYERCNTVANNGLFLTFFNFLLFFLIGLTLTNTFVSTQTSNLVIIEDADIYLTIVLCLSIGLFFQMMFERLLQSTGLTLYSMICQVTGAVINIILDPIMIFGFGPIPALGVAGAAYATVIGQSVAAIIGLVLNLKKNKEIQFSLKRILSLEKEMIINIYKVGIPSILMMSIGSFMTYMMNRILIVFSTTATAVFGVYFRLQSFFFMPVFGLNNGLIPVLAYNYGARNRSRIQEALRFSLILAFVIMLIGTIVMNLFPATLLQIFNASEEMLRIGIPALKRISLSFPLAAIAIIMGSIFQAFAKSIYSLIISVARQILVLIPSAWLFAQTGNVNNVWYSFLLSELVSVLVSYYFFRSLYRTTIETM